MSAEVPKDDTGGPASDKPHSNERYKKTDDSTPPASPKTHVPPPACDTQTTKTKEKNGLDKCRFFVEIVTLIVVSVYTYTACNQLNEMRRSTDAATSAANTAAATLKSSAVQFRQQVRPYVVPEGIRILSFPAENAKIGVEAILMNTGSTPAFRVRVSNNIRIQGRPLVCPGGSGSGLQNSQSIANLGAGIKRVSRIFTTISMNKTMIEAIKNKKLLVCHSLLLEYFDVFGYKHQTSACSYFDVPDAGASVGPDDLFLISCPDHNWVK